MIYHLFEIQPEAIKFFNFMKIFLRRYDDTLPNIEKLFGGYLLKLLVIFYLQSENLLPSVETVQRKTAKKIIDGNYIKIN